MIWYLENLQRNRTEREALETLASSVTWLTPVGWRIDADLRLVWDADIAIPAGNRQVSLRYPNHFPYSPPLVLPRGDRTAGPSTSGGQVASCAWNTGRITGTRSSQAQT
jgi:hypothetical protein